MKPIVFPDRPFEQWLSNAVEWLVDRPLDSSLAKSLFSSLNNNFREMPDGYTLEVAVPGMSKKDLKLEIDNQVLTVQGQKQQKNKRGWFNKTSTFQSIQLYKTFVLPENADANGIRAKCKDGLLKISIPKLKNERTDKVIQIKVGAEPEINWWQKLTRSFKSWWIKGQGK